MMKITNLATHPERYATVGEIADYLHVSERYIYKLVDLGTLTTVETPSSRLVRVSVASVRRAFRETA